MREIALNYKRQTASRYLPVSKDEIISKIIDSELYGVSIKYDGHLYLLHFDGKKVVLVNHGGNVIEDLPLNKEALTLLKDKCKDVLLAGELYLFKEGERTRSFDLAAALNTKSPDIYFAAFDIITLNGSEGPINLKDLDNNLQDLLKNSQSLHAAQNTLVESRKDVLQRYTDLVEQGGHEGIVVRSQNGPIYKAKPLISLEAIILGYAEGEGSRAGMLQEFLVGLCVAENEYILLTKVGNGYSTEQRIKLFKEFEQKKADSGYIEVSGSNVAFTMVQPDQVMEFSCLDMFSDNSKGPITKTCLSYSNGVYTATGKRSMVSVISPVYVGMRSDKKPDMQDAGLSQITKIISLDQATSEQVDLKKSDLLMREVYVKESKGTKMVRKFMIWKTNKEETGQYPAYVFHYTDFSAGRAEMLQRDIKVSNSKEQIEEIFAAEVVANVKKGWNRV